jgi:hypothetical protein
MPQSKPAASVRFSGRFWLTVFSLLPALVAPNSAHGQVVINEVMAANRRAVANASGDYPDWLELYNGSSTPMDLGGMFIRSVEDNGARRETNVFRFPPIVLLEGGARLVVWFDNNTNAPGYHTRFPLERTGCILTLHQPNATVILGAGVVFGLQATDFSIGRVPDGSATWTINVPTPGQANLAQPLGPIMALRINEWAASNTVEKCTQEIELESSGPLCPDWLELYNSSALPVELSGLTITDRPLTPAVALQLRAFTNLSFIGPRDFQMFLCDDEWLPQSHLKFRLSSTDGETLRIYATDRSTIIHEVTFPGNSLVPGYWPGDISYGCYPDGEETATRMFIVPTPGEPNYDVMTNVVINEVLSRSASPFEDAIELKNTTDHPIDIGGWWLSDDRLLPRKFRIPGPSVIPPQGYAVFYEMRGVTELPRRGFNTGDGALPEDFAFNKGGDDVWLFSATNDAPGTLNGYRSGLVFGRAESNVSFGPLRTSLEQDHVVSLDHPTFGVNNPASVEQFRTGTGAPNARPRISPIVVTEIYYHPPRWWIGGNTYENEFDEFIEVYNRTTNAVPLYDPANYGWGEGRTNTWRLAGGLTFQFPTNLVLVPGEFMLVTHFDHSGQEGPFRQRFKVPPDVRIAGNYVNWTNIYDSEDREWDLEEVGLHNDGGTIELQRPDSLDGPGLPLGYLPTERVTYDDGFPWSPEADGGVNIFRPDGVHIGYSLQKVIIEDYANDAINWMRANPTPGRQEILVHSFSRSATEVTLQFYGWAGASYTVEYAPTVTVAMWTVLTNISRSASSGIRVASDGGPTDAARFYRVRSP